MKKYILLIIICFALSNCKSTKINDTCAVDLNFNDKLYRADLPCYRQKQNEVEYHGGKQYTFSYKTRGMFFVNNNPDQAPNILSKYLSEEQYSSFLFNDSLNYEGKDPSNNTFWKVVKKDGFLRGYLNVLKEHKDAFDDAILSIRIKVK